MKRATLALAAAALVTGCASPIGPIVEERLRQAGPDMPVRCMEECKAEWERAQVWLAKHSRWKIQTATTVMVETFNPVGSDPSYGFSVLKDPQQGGGYRVTMSLRCGNAFGCNPEPHQVRRAFYHYVATGQDLLEGAGFLSGIR